MRQSHTHTTRKLGKVIFKKEMRARMNNTYAIEAQTQTQTYSQKNKDDT